ncbi:CidA/LrgA family protein [Psychrobacter sp. I-STPA10]|uniref:CidA/LrgA family protein n=1 Tax=Psychrobacter sp. I-STPA10 TaxID=2585769 RepID=UPI001E5683FF|nr:CidA/LrgA family protein [Psychrobacter sp. I-STPA10]
MTQIQPPQSSQLSLPIAIVLTLLMVIIIREGAVLVCRALDIESAANIVGMIVMFIILMVWRLTKGLPEWISRASNRLLVDSGFAFLPVSAGAGLLLFALGDEFWGIVITIIVSTLIPLWGLAKLANHWLKDTPDNSINTHPTASQNDTTSSQ